MVYLIIALYRVYDSDKASIFDRFSMGKGIEARMIQMLRKKKDFMAITLTVSLTSLSPCQSLGNRLFKYIVSLYIWSVTKSRLKSKEGDISQTIIGLTDFGKGEGAGLTVLKPYKDTI